jgi:hypothetical protein
MRSLLFIVTTICVFGAAICQVPPTPQLPQQFTSNFSVVFPDYVSPTNEPIYLGGFFALDYTVGGLKIELGGEEFVPLSFHTNVVVSPSQGVLTPYIYEGPLCWQFGAVPSVILTYFPFEIPANATFLGNKIVAGQPCTGWQFDINVFGIITLITPATLWVSTKTDTIVQMIIGDIDYAGVNQVQVNFFDTILGPFSPSIYAPPTKANPNVVCRQINF